MDPIYKVLYDSSHSLPWFCRSDPNVYIQVSKLLFISYQLRRMEWCLMEAVGIQCCPKLLFAVLEDATHENLSYKAWLLLLRGMVLLVCFILKQKAGIVR
jgi:hypothetical protein